AKPEPIVVVADVARQQVGIERGIRSRRCGIEARLTSNSVFVSREHQSQREPRERWAPVLDCVGLMAEKAVSAWRQLEKRGEVLAVVPRWRLMTRRADDRCHGPGVATFDGVDAGDSDPTH